MSRPETPLLTVDIVIELTEQVGSIVVVERKYPPLGLALPGGFVDVGETVEHAARREAKEETGLDVQLTCLLSVYSEPGRDRRGHTVSVVFLALAEGAPVAGDDAAAVKMVDPHDPTLEYAFDHRRILDDFLNFKATGRLPDPAARLIN